MWIVRLLFICLVFVPSLSGALCFDEAGKAYGINSNLLQSIARIESNLNPNAVNKNQNGSTDIGLMQINSSWISSMGLDSGRLLSDPCYNVKTGARVLKFCLDKHGYTWEAVGCYNAVSKPKRVNYSWKVFNMLKSEKTRQDTSKKQDLQDSGQNSKDSELKTLNPSFSFSMRDNAAID